MFRGFSEPNIKPSRYPCGWERQRGPGKEKKLPWGIWQSIWFNCRSVTLGELTVPDSEVGDCEDHGVPGEDVVATEILLLSKADPPSHSHLHHLGQDCWAEERWYKKDNSGCFWWCFFAFQVIFIRLNVISDLWCLKHRHALDTANWDQVWEEQSTKKKCKPFVFYKWKFTCIVIAL